MTEFNDGNQWHYVTDPAAYERARLMYEYRVASGSTGQMLVDTQWVQQRAAMQPLLDGMLYYQKPYNKESPEAQANLFCDLLGHLAPNEMVMLDIEGDINVPDPADFMRRWCAVVEPRLNTLAWIYVPQSLSGALTRAVTGNRIVKAPKYSGTDQRGPAPSWPYDVHQYTDKGAFPGGNGPGDANFTDLTVAQMLDRCRLAPPQPAPGVPMPPRRAMWSPNCDDRPRNVTWLCFHTQEGGGTADSLARYLDNPASGVSYNTVGDAAELIDVVPFDRSPWAALGANGRADHFCFGGSFSAWSRQQWLDCGMLDNAAAWLADRATVRGIPIAYVGTDGVRNNQPGVIGHVDWTRGANEGSHTDPGPNFPWDELTARAQRFTNPAPQGVDVTPDECRQAIRDVLNEQAPTRVPGSTVNLGLGDCIRNADAASFIALHAVTDPITSGVPGSTVQMPPRDVWRNADAAGFEEVAQMLPQIVARLDAIDARLNAPAGSTAASTPTVGA